MFRSDLILHTTPANKHKDLILNCLAVFSSLHHQRKHFGSSSKVLFCYINFHSVKSCLCKRKKKSFVLCIYDNVCIVFMFNMCKCLKRLVCNSIVCLVASYLCEIGTNFKTLILVHKHFFHYFYIK